MLVNTKKVRDEHALFSTVVLLFYNFSVFLVLLIVGCESFANQHAYLFSHCTLLGMGRSIALFWEWIRSFEIEGSIALFWEWIRGFEIEQSACCLLTSLDNDSIKCTCGCGDIHSLSISALVAHLLTPSLWIIQNKVHIKQFRMKVSV